MSFLTHPAPKHMLDTPVADTDTRSRAVEPRRAKPRVSVVVGRRLAAGAGALTAAAVIGSAAATTASATPQSHRESQSVSGYSGSHHSGSERHGYRGYHGDRGYHGYRHSHHASTYTGSSGSGSSSSNSGTSSSSAANSSGSSAASTSTSAVSSDGLSANTTAVMKAIKAKYPSVTFSTGGSQDHATGHAVDIMIPNAGSASGKQLGDEIAAYLKANQSTFHVHYLIWQQKIWNIQRDSEGWRSMEDRGSTTANHYDHVHVSVY
ncbi:hypothetical protein [Acidipropionibacterium virtanenii]|uniref:ARB-07466-like C-terminal domain-containing protein n=1 Tax=Acidipropionibacterium virtanenii TaxID=2057246 RepID=A0A344UWH0_9ACTN|nr:hypothetical protein [Acidipropionibacterium virtanenii]AXE39618.1 hypothetical protein JS278_02480 [Acidipropionibacterium virtanenii]